MADRVTFVRFDTSQANLITWAARTGLAPLSDEELDAAYTRAHDFIRKNKDRLVKEHSWTELEAEGDELFRVFDASGLGFKEYPTYFSLPTTFTSLRNSIMLYEFEAQIQRPSSIDHDLVVAGPVPLCNIFDLSQCIAPGILLLAAIDELETGESEEYVRALPIENWISNHEDSLTTVLGNPKVYQDLLEASRDHARSFYKSAVGPESDGSPYEWFERDEWYGEGWDDGSQGGGGRPSNRSASDFAACGSDCGWCGHCFY